MRINELKIGKAYLIEMPTGYISDFLVMTKTYNEDFVKLYDVSKKRYEWYSQDELAASKILGEVMWLERVSELHEKLFSMGLSHSDTKFIKEERRRKENEQGESR